MDLFKLQYSYMFSFLGWDWTFIEEDYADFILHMNKDVLVKITSEWCDLKEFELATKNIWKGKCMVLGKWIHDFHIIKCGIYYAFESYRFQGERFYPHKNMNFKKRIHLTKTKVAMWEKCRIACSKIQYHLKTHLSILDQAEDEKLQQFAQDLIIQRVASGYRNINMGYWKDEEHFPCSRCGKLLEISRFRIHQYNSEEDKDIIQNFNNHIYIPCGMCVYTYNDKDYRLAVDNKSMAITRTTKNISIPLNKPKDNPYYVCGYCGMAIRISKEDWIGHLNKEFTSYLTKDQLAQLSRKRCKKFNQGECKKCSGHLLYYNFHNDKQLIIPKYGQYYTCKYCRSAIRISKEDWSGYLEETYNWNFGRLDWKYVPQLPPNRCIKFNQCECKKCGGGISTSDFYENKQTTCTDCCKKKAIKRYNNKCVACYKHLYPNLINNNGFKLKENYVVDELKRECIPKFIRDKRITGGTSRYRPDVYYDFKEYAIIVEVDEHQHTEYLGEDIRALALQTDAKKPIHLVRFNPDQYYIGKKRIPSCWKNSTVVDLKIWNARLDTLIDLLEKLFTTAPKEIIEIHRLYYNC